MNYRLIILFCLFLSFQAVSNDEERDQALQDMGISQDNFRDMEDADNAQNRAIFEDFERQAREDGIEVTQEEIDEAERRSLGSQPDGGTPTGNAPSAEGLATTRDTGGGGSSAVEKVSGALVGAAAATQVGGIVLDTAVGNKLKDFCTTGPPGAVACALGVVTLGVAIKNMLDPKNNGTKTRAVAKQVDQSGDPSGRLRNSDLNPLAGGNGLGAGGGPRGGPLNQNPFGDIPDGVRNDDGSVDTAALGQSCAKNPSSPLCNSFISLQKTCQKTGCDVSNILGPNPQIKGPNGKVVQAPFDQEAFVKAGFTPQQAASAFQTYNKVGQQEMDKIFGKNGDPFGSDLAEGSGASGEEGSDEDLTRSTLTGGGGGGRGSLAGSRGKRRRRPSSDDDFDFSKQLEDLLKKGADSENPQGTVYKPLSIGKDKIGTRYDNIFQMVSRSYKSKRAPASK